MLARRFALVAALVAIVGLTFGAATASSGASAYWRASGSGVAGASAVAASASRA